MKVVIKRVITAAALGILFWTAFIYLPAFVFSGILIAILLQIIFFEWKNLFDLHQLTFWLLMPIYPILPFALLIDMNHSDYRYLLFVLFVIVFSHDTGSYIFGTLWGKHKIYPAISPGKTWEGFWGGYVTAVLGLRVLLWEQEISKPWWFIFAFTLAVCALSLAGDLFESWLKRRAQVKDSGQILPGHGGFLDRFDGIMFAVFFFYFFKDYLSTVF
jgi:phosphatidate cytidylyltransferase